MPSRSGALSLASSTGQPRIGSEMETVMETSPRKVEGLSENEVLDLCRSEVETMHNVHYLMSCPDVPRDTMQRYLADMSRSLEHLTDILCRPKNRS